MSTMTTQRTEPARVRPVTENDPPVPLGCADATHFAETRVRVGHVDCLERVGFTTKAAAQRWAASYNRRIFGKALGEAARNV